MTARIGRVPDWLLPAPAIFLMAWGGNHFTPLLHLYELLGHYAAWQANLLLGMYVAGLIPGLLVASALSDRLGRKPVLVVGTIVGIVGSAALAAGLHDLWLLCVGRALAGLAVGVAMSVGSSTVKELSSGAFDPDAPASAGARRSSLTLTLGFAIGAGATGALGQWGPAPTESPYVLHGALSLLALVPLALVPESLPLASRATGAWWRDLRVPAAGSRRFVRVVAPAAPWVFAAAGVAYAIMPSLVQQDLGDFATLYAAVLTVLTLGTGALTQTLVPRIDRVTGGRSITIGLAAMTCGMLLALVVSLVRDPILALAVAVLLGGAYGILVVAGLLHVQAIATSRDLAGLTGVYYSLTYTGFLLPTLLAALMPIAPYSLSLGIVAALCFTSFGLVTRETTRMR